MSDTPSEEPRYDPCEREPRTYGEMWTLTAYWADFSTPGSTKRRIAITPNGRDYVFLARYCKDAFGSTHLEAVGKLGNRYGIATGKTDIEIDETTLREMADHFRRLADPPPAGQAPTPPTDHYALAAAFLAEAKRKETKPTGKELADRLGVTRTALYENKEYALIRNLANDLFGMFEKKKDAGDWRGALGTKDKSRTIEAADPDDEPIEDKAVD